uniref:Uncharacterized protein n=1 Tax=Arundo donax TaxID=35708 RepID=A0A0A9AQC8_ARUDO
MGKVHENPDDFRLWHCSNTEIVGCQAASWDLPLLSRHLLLSPSSIAISCSSSLVFIFPCGHAGTH